MLDKVQVQAAQDLQGGLRNLSTKLNDLANLRTTQRNAQLGSPQSDNWQGPDRDAFETQYKRQQSELADLMNAANTLIGQIQKQIDGNAQANNKG